MLDKTGLLDAMKQETKYQARLAAHLLYQTTAAKKSN